ncbi:hypothetical protein [Ensifer soli]|uniref:hypothetical protein n=1 Tax=Ciceribacter sp. sgz301302 TaxID=3342379 RepID=UPI0035B87B0D
MTTLVRTTIPTKEHFAEIGSVKRIRDGITYTLKLGWPTRVIASAGYGKTTALFYLAEEFEGVYCNVGHAHKQVADMYRMPIRASGHAPQAAYGRDLFDEVIW